MGKVPDSVVDRDLIAECLNGHSFAWDALVERYESLIYTCALRHGATETEAGDVFQVVCVSLYEYLGSLRDQTRLASWLLSVTKREAWRAARKRDYSASLEAGDEGFSVLETTPTLNPSDNPEGSAMATEDAYLVQLALEQLGDKCRELLRALYSSEEQSYAEIAAKLSIPIGSIGPTRARCLQQLRRILETVGF